MWKERSEGTQPRGGRPTRLCVAVLAAVALLGAACGGTTARGEGVASVDEGKGAAPKASQQDDKQRAKDPEKAMLDFARCMRDHGVDMPDPKPGQDGMTRFEGPSGGDEPLLDESKFMEADKACRHLMGDAGPPQLSPEDQKQVQDAMLAFARCMRGHGVEMPDPQPGGGGIVAEVGEGADPRSPEFQAAEKDCRKHTEAMDKKLGVTRSEK